MPIANINGQKINYVDNETDGPVIIWNHGFLMDHTMFDDQVAALGNEYRCIRWDQRGFGKTPATGPFTYWDSADDCIALLAHLEIESAVLAGMSQGGFLSLRAALRYPDRVRALILIDSEAAVDSAEVIEGYKQMIAHWLTDAPLGPVGETVAGLILGEPKLGAEWIEKWEARRDPVQMKFAADALTGREDISERLGELRMPILSIHGEADLAISIDKAEALQAAVADARGLIRVPGAAHAPNMTHPDIVNTAIREFLESL